MAAQEVPRVTLVHSSTKPSTELLNPLQLALVYQHSCIVQCVVYDDFLSEQQNFQPLGEKKRDRELMFSSCSGKCYLCIFISAEVRFYWDQI